jgi:hypothetical protein
MARHRYVDPIMDVLPHMPLDINDDLALGVMLSDDDGNAIKRRVLEMTLGYQRW